MPEGFSLSLSSNGVGVLTTLGLDEAVLAAGSPVSRWTMWNGTGKPSAWVEGRWPEGDSIVSSSSAFL